MRGTIRRLRKDHKASTFFFTSLRGIGRREGIYMDGDRPYTVAFTLGDHAYIRHCPTLTYYQTMLALARHYAQGAQGSHEEADPSRSGQGDHGGPRSDPLGLSDRPTAP